MLTKTKSIYLTVLFFFLMLTGLQAQTKYEYAIINYIPYLRTLEISINGATHKEINVPKEKRQNNYDVNAALEEVNKMTDEGWELFDTGLTNYAAINHPVYVFYLRKKK